MDMAIENTIKLLIFLRRPVASTKGNDPACLKLGDCLVGVLKVFENCLGDVWQVPGG